jgi:predicted lipid-binding transport protein (Tim44 family)
MMVNAKLMGIETLDSSYLASVRFVGTLKEEVDGPTTSFDEVWNLTKPISAQGGWMLAGIQQMDEIA